MSSKGAGGGNKRNRGARGGENRSRGRGAQNRARRGVARSSRPERVPFDASVLEGASALEVSNVALPLDAGLRGPHAEELTREALGRALGIAPEKIVSHSLVKRSVDARKKANVRFNAAFEVHLASDASARKLSPARGVSVRPHVPPEPLTIPDLHAQAVRGDERIVVAGMGPAGLFCALYLAEAGLRPLVVERGAAVDERLAAIESFNAGGALDTAANVQFGEGGAGTFSDGKLTTGTKSTHIRHVLEAFVQAGAPAEILWQAKPHIGTDKLPDVVKNIRERIISAGGEVRFLTRLADVEMASGQVRAAVLEDSRTGARETVPASRIVVACGHSARDVFELARDRGFALERKPFSMGVRIEHPQALINRAQYGSAANHAALGAADYKMAVRVPAGKDAGQAREDGRADSTRGVYTFCMCPGGEVVAAASEEGGVVVNGMSRFARDGENANSALLADVRPDDLPGDDVMEGVRLQRKVERAAFDLAARNGGAPYAAPAQTVGDFLSVGAAYGLREARGSRASRNAAAHPVRPSYPRGVVWCDLRECLPDFIADALGWGLPLLDAKLHGFADAGAVLTGPETRSSSPIRMVRGTNFQARLASASGLADVSPAQGGELDDDPRTGVYPCGEGAGYAGGIMSAAVDGLRVAETIASQILSTQGR